MSGAVSNLPGWRVVKLSDFASRFKIWFACEAMGKITSAGAPQQYIWLATSKQWSCTIISIGLRLQPQGWARFASRSLLRPNAKVVKAQRWRQAPVILLKNNITLKMLKHNICSGSPFSDPPFGASVHNCDIDWARCDWPNGDAVLCPETQSADWWPLHTHDTWRALH